MEAEFDEPFDEIVIGFAEMGFSRVNTALAMEISLPYLRDAIHVLGLGHFFKPQSGMREESRGVGVSHSGGWPKGKKRPPVYLYTEEELLTLVDKYRTMAEFQMHTGIAWSTVCRRFGKFSTAQEIVRERRRSKRLSKVQPLLPDDRMPKQGGDWVR